MKANELMIGDWVLSKSISKPCKVVGIDPMEGMGREGYTFKLKGPNNILLFVHAISVEPIPLTPEILEKNGFKMQYGDEAKKTPMYATWMVDTSIMFEYYFHEGILREYWCSDEAFATFPAGMSYLHQLQHALRLCGIVKEIEL